MSAASQHQTVLDTVVMLADQIARTSPECAEQAMQIVKLVHELGAGPTATSSRMRSISETVDTDLSDARVQTTADAVMRAVRTDLKRSGECQPWLRSTMMEVVRVVVIMKPSKAVPKDADLMGLLGLRGSGGADFGF